MKIEKMLERDRQAPKDHYVKNQAGCAKEVEIGGQEKKLSSNLGHIIK